MKKNSASVALQGVFSGSPDRRYPPKANRGARERKEKLKKKGETLRTNPNAGLEVLGASPLHPHQGLPPLDPRSTRTPNTQI